MRLEPTPPNAFVLSGIQFNEVREILQSAWEAAQARRHRRHEEWRDRMLGRASRWRDLIEKNEGVISSLEDQIDRWQEMEANARSPDFAEQVRGWTEEKQRKIEDIRATNRELEERIHSVNDKLRNRRC